MDVSDLWGVSIQVKVAERVRKETLTAGTLLTTKEAMVNTVMMALHTTKAAVGRISKSEGHRARKYSGPR